ncbi:hypothetical protein N431DRAFT_431530 [Stipitochalara longipes BDJ]|nr:hypothetical protein N431DRAFT_431530 [Stipitochalara longipes BDJ]
MAQPPSPELPSNAWAEDPGTRHVPEHQEPAPSSDPVLPIQRRPLNNQNVQTDLQFDEPTTDPVEKTPDKAPHPTIQSSNEITIEEQKAPPPISLYGKLGAFVSAILVAGTICILAATGFLWFLWLADYRNSTWHQIVYNNWFTRCVSLSALVIRTAVSLQSSAATSMIASLALERTGVLLLHFASVSLTRHANGGPYMLAWWLLKTCIRSPERWANSILPALITTLTILTIAIQFTTTALLSDVNSIVIPGPSGGIALATNFAYNANGNIPVITRGTTWTLKPPFYPIFAEYHEDAPETPDGVSDTGLTLRAFVPLQSQQSRTQLKDYEGRATVLDSRVICMRPNLTSERAHVSDSMLAFNGSFNAPFNASRLEYFAQNNTFTGPLADWNARNDIQFSCLAALNYTVAVLGNVESDPTVDAPHWRLSICQPEGLNSSGVLLSEFRTLSDAPRHEIYGDTNYANGNAYLAINVSSGTEVEWLNGIGYEPSQFGIVTGPGAAPLAYSDHGEWLDLLFSDDATLRLSVSLCYTAFDTADLNVAMSGEQNRTEPVPSYDTNTSGYTYGAIREQYGQFPDGRISYASDDTTARGILTLQKRASWLPGAGDYVFNGETASGGTSWITDFGNMGGPIVLGATNDRLGWDTTAFLYNAYRDSGDWTDIDSINPDPSMIALVQEIVQSGGTIAFALQSIITSLASVAYYDQLQQFNDVNSITYSEFIVATARAKFRGLTGVTVVIAVHLLLMGGIVGLFLLRAKLSTVGNSWQAVAQVNGEMTRPLLETAAFSTDAKVKGVLQANEWGRKVVEIAVLEDGKGTKIVGMRDKHETAASVTGSEAAG